MPEPRSVLVLDNLDSFTYNLVDELTRRAARVRVVRNDRPASEIAAAAQATQLLVISPGPGTPAGAGCTLAAIRACAGRVPIFGVCLGLQAIVEALGGAVDRGQIRHARATPVTHSGGPIFEGLPNPMPAGRYHSLAAVAVPACLRVTARSEGAVMAVEHRSLPVAGVQFHPESVLTPHGGRLLDNVLRWASRAGR